MKLRHFLQAVFAALAAFFVGWSKEQLRFYWMGEESEIFVAPSLEALNEAYDRRGGNGPFRDEPLTMDNFGTEWGYADADEIVIDEETGEESTYAQVLEVLEKRDWFQRNPVTQIATSYN